MRGTLFKEKLCAASRDSDSRHLILSAEELSNFSEQDIQHLVNFLETLSLECFGICYVRDYKGLQESRFQQALRIPGNQGSCLPPTDKRFNRFQYRKKIEKFLKIVGRKMVTLRRFQKAVLEKGCVVRDFCKVVGISQYNQDVMQSNKSLSLNAVRLLYSYRKFEQGADRARDEIQANRLLCEKLSELGGQKATFHSTIFLRSESAWRADVDWISNLLGHDMLGDLYADDEKECLQTEEDLFNFSPASLEWLACESQIKPSRLKSGAPQSIAEAVGQLQKKLVKEPGDRPKFWTRLSGFLR